MIYRSDYIRNITKLHLFCVSEMRGTMDKRHESSNDPQKLFGFVRPRSIELCLFESKKEDQLSLIL